MTARYSAKNKGGVLRFYRQRRRSSSTGLRHASIAVTTLSLFLGVLVLLAGDKHELYAGTGLTMAVLFFLSGAVLSLSVFPLLQIKAMWSRHLACALLALPVPLGLLCLWIWSSVG